MQSFAVIDQQVDKTIANTKAFFQISKNWIKIARVAVIRSLHQNALQRRLTLCLKHNYAVICHQVA